MENRRFNLQTAVAMLFIFILVVAAVTTVFGQEKKEKTKIIQLKVTEDENGNVTSVDTTMVLDGDKPFGYLWNTDTDHIGDSLTVKLDFDMDDFNTVNIDSLLQNIQMKIDGNNTMMFFDTDMDEAMKDLDEKMQHLSFQWQSLNGDQDSLVEIIMQGIGNTQDSVWQKHFNVNISDEDGDGQVFVFSDGKNVTIDRDGNVKVIKLNGGDPEQIFTKDTVIQDGNTKIIIRSNKDGEELKQTIEYITSDEDGENGNVEVRKESNVKVIRLKNDDVKWTDKDGTVYKPGDDDFRFVETEDASKDDLKSAGIKAKKRQLEPVDLTFSPNPNNGKFNLSFTLKEKKNVTINIFDISGKLVYSETLKDFQGTYNKEIDLSREEQGTFFLQIIQGMYDIIKKIIIQ